MQKVVGSSPIIRFKKTPINRGSLFAATATRAPDVSPRLDSKLPWHSPTSTTHIATRAKGKVEAAKGRPLEDAAWVPANAERRHDQPLSSSGHPSCATVATSGVTGRYGATGYSGHFVIDGARCDRLPPATARHSPCGMCGRAGAYCGNGSGWTSCRSSLLRASSRCACSTAVALLVEPRRLLVLPCLLALHHARQGARYEHD